MPEQTDKFLLSKESETLEGELVEADAPLPITVGAEERDVLTQVRKRSSHRRQRYYLRYVFLPLLLLTSALLGGMRLAGTDSGFIFLKPSLLCLIFAVLLLLLYFRAGLISWGGWLSEDFSGVKNAANFMVLATLFAASAQLFNSLLPEQGLPFWVVGFCFFWTLWNNLFADFDTKKLLRSLGALFGLAFVVKYLVLANLAAPPSESWLRSIIENPARETFTWLLDLPRFSQGTGYIQFFAVGFYLAGLFLLPQTTAEEAK